MATFPTWWEQAKQTAFSALEARKNNIITDWGSQRYSDMVSDLQGSISQIESGLPVSETDIVRWFPTFQNQFEKRQVGPSAFDYALTPQTPVDLSAPNAGEIARAAEQGKTLDSTGMATPIPQTSGSITGGTTGTPAELGDPLAVPEGTVKVVNGVNYLSDPTGVWREITPENAAFQQNPTPAPWQQTIPADAIDDTTGMINTAEGPKPFNEVVDSSGNVAPGITIVSPSQGPIDTSGGTGGAGGGAGGGGTSGTGNAVLDELLASIQTYLNKLTESGKTINPYVDITPEKLAEFLKQAENEIDPYYSTQLKLAREAILTDLDYSKDEVARFEQDLEKTYGKSLRTIGENAAEQGFALSGQRQLSEQDLAYQTQRQIEDQRNTFAYNASKGARTFAQEWGKPDFATPTIGATPTVRAGERTFATTGTTMPVYELSNDIYDKLVGTKQYEQTAAKLSRQAQLEGAFKTSELSKRYLALA